MVMANVRIAKLMRFLVVMGMNVFLRKRLLLRKRLALNKKKRASIRRTKSFLETYVGFAYNKGRNLSQLFSKRGAEMNETLGLALVIGFPVVLGIAIWAFGKTSVEPE
jgi:hypothetical protein